MGGLQAIGAGASADRTSKAGADLPGGSTLGRVPHELLVLSGDPEVHHRRHQRTGGGPGLRHPALCRPRFAAESAVFTTSFAQRGLIAEHGVSWLLPRLVGLPTALDLLCSPASSARPKRCRSAW
jgi:hypothetical protein